MTVDVLEDEALIHDSASPTETRGMTLTHDVVGTQCCWVVAYGMTRTWYRHPDQGSFDCTGMSAEQVAATVVLEAVETIIGAQIGNPAIYSADRRIMSVLRDVETIIPGLSVVNDEPEWLKECHHEMDALVGDWNRHATSQQRKDDRAAWLSGVSPLVVHVDASARLHRKTIGIGYVISDEVRDPLTGVFTPDYHLISATGQSEPEGLSTLAELRAIKRAITNSLVLTNEVKSGKRGLKVYSDSQNAIGMLTALRTGGTYNGPALKIQWESARAIVDRISGIEDIQFYWVRGHDGDPRNEAADRLAVAARRNEEMDIPKEVSLSMVENISLDMKLALAAKQEDVSSLREVS